MLSEYHLKQEEPNGRYFVQTLCKSPIILSQDFSARILGQVH